MKRSVLGTLLGLLFCFLANAQEATVKATLEPAEILIGDEVSLTLQISYPPDYRLQSIGLGVLEQVDSVEVKYIAPADTASRSPRVNVVQKITLTSFEEGQHIIPPIPVNFFFQDGEVSLQTKTLQLIVKTIPINPTDSVGLQPIKDIIREPLKLQDILPYLALLAGCVAVGLLVWYFFNRNKVNRPKETITAPPPAPHELAFQRIAALQKEQYLDKAEFKAYQSQISYILREYLEGRYHIAALETTTFDLLKKLTLIDLPKGWFDPLKRLLQQADRVKFAKAELPIDVHQKSLDRLINFIEETIPSSITTEEESIQKEEEE